MKSHAQYRDWLHRYMVEVDNTRPDSDHCRKIARVAGKLACRHALGGEWLLRSEKVKTPTETVALLAVFLEEDDSEWYTYIMRYEVELKPWARKDLHRISKPNAARIVDALEKLEDGCDSS